MNKLDLVELERAHAAGPAAAAPAGRAKTPKKKR
jgi:hypothetical protein